MALLAMQLPLAATSILSELMPNEPTRNALTLGLLACVGFPTFVFFSTLSTVTTFAALRHWNAGRDLGVSGAYAEALRAAPRWFPAALVTSLLTLLGMPLIFLGIYFSAIYLFVPQVILMDPPCPLGVYLTRSKKVAKADFTRVLLLAVLLLVLDIGLYLVAQEAGGRIGDLFASPTAREIVSGTVNCVVTVAPGLLLNPLIGEYFLKLRSMT